MAAKRTEAKAETRPVGRVSLSRKRTDADYEIEALSKGLAVLEALEGASFEPVTQKRIEQRTGFNRDLVMRTLKTFRLRGWAIQNDRGEWTVGPGFVRFAKSVARRNPF